MTFYVPGKRFVCALTCLLALSMSVSAYAQSGSYGEMPPPATGIHPRIFLTPTELPTLKNRILTKPASGYYQSALRVAAQLTTNANLRDAVSSLENGQTVNEATREKLSDILREAGLVALLTDDPALHDSSVRALLAFVHGVAPDTPKIDYSRNATGVAIAYDFLYNSLSDQQRTLVRTWLADVCTRWEAQLRPAPYGFKPGASLRNFNWVGYITGAFGLTALSIEGEPGYENRWYTSAASSMTDFLQYGIGPEGAPVETIHYFAYGMGNGAYFLDAMARRGAPVWNHPHLSKLPRWWAYDLLPWGKQFNSLADTRDLTLGVGEIYYRLALAYPNDPIMQWVYRNHIESHNGGPLFATSGMLWTAPPTGPTSAEALNLPLMGLFSYSGLVYLRSGWGVNDTYFEIQSDPVSAGPSHAHADRNSFTLMSQGRIWAMAPGFHYSLDVDQNYVLIDGKGEGFFPQPGRRMDTADAGWAAAFMGDATDAYSWQVNRTQGPNDGKLVNGWRSSPYNPVLHAYRSGIMVRGAHSYVVLADDIQKDEKEHEYAWQMLTPLGSVIDTPTPATALIHPIDAGRHLRPHPGVNAKQLEPIRASFSVPTNGVYHLWVLMGHKYTGPFTWGETHRIDGGAAVRFFARESDNAQIHWQDITVVNKISGVNLSAGPHLIEFSSLGDMYLAALLVAPDGYDPTGAQPVSPPANATLIRFADLGTPRGWQAVDPERAQPQLLVQVVSSAQVTLKADVFRPPFSDAPPGPPVLRLQAVTNAVAPRFRVLLYPHKSGAPMPRVQSSSTGMVVSWPDGIVDTWTFGKTTGFAGLNEAAVQVQRKAGGTTQTLQLYGKP